MAEASPDHSTRTIGMAGATYIGVGAIVGGGILVLAGTAFATTGPGAILAFGLNGLIALVTAASFAELGTAFPESGGPYAFAKRLVSVRAAFAVGWILWFAYIVAAVLYALGFSAFCVLAVEGLWAGLGDGAPGFVRGRSFSLLLAVGATLGYALSLARQASPGGRLATAGKVVLFVGLILAGLVALLGQPLPETTSALQPFLPEGRTGLLMAMGFTFIALQGFDLIPAVGGEIREPGKTIPRAMFLSLGVALVIYIPLLFIVSTVGIPDSENIADLARANPETVVPEAASRFLGAPGYWLVVLAAILSTLSALNSNLMAASRVALSMARDRNLPIVLGTVHSERQTPVVAVYASTLAVLTIALMVPDLASAGAAASLIFLLSFASTHIMALLSRERTGGSEERFLTPGGATFPVLGVLACGGLALFQGVVVPSAGAVTAVWLGFGGLLYMSLFARGAELADASAQALDPRLGQLRGKSPLVLLPIANPANAPGLAAVANALAPSRFGRVLLLSVVPLQRSASATALPLRLERAQEVVRQALTLSYEGGNTPEALITAASSPLEEIRRVADEHRCESLLIGIGDGEAGPGEPALQQLLNEVDCDVAVMRCPNGWRLENARRIVVPIAGGGDQHELRARLLGSLCRSGERTVTFLTILPSSASRQEVRDARREVELLADLKVGEGAEVRVLRSDDPKGALLDEATRCDMLVLGLRSKGGSHISFGRLALRVSREATCATIMLGRKRPRAWIN